MGCSMGGGCNIAGRVLILCYSVGLHRDNHSMICSVERWDASKRPDLPLLM